VVVVVIDATRTALRFFFNCNGIARKLELTVLSNLLWDPPLLLVVLVLRIVRSDPKRRGMSTVGFVVVGINFDFSHKIEDFGATWTPKP
jgi:hypothetical protein